MRMGRELTKVRGGGSRELQKVYAELTSQIADAQPNAAHYYPGWLLAKGHIVEFDLAMSVGAKYSALSS